MPNLPPMKLIDLMNAGAKIVSGMEPYPLQPQVVACQWMSIAKGTIVHCGEMPTQKAANDCWYCKFHFDIGKDFKPFESEGEK